MKKFLRCISIIFLFLINNLAAQSTFQKIFYHTNPGFQLEDQINKLIIDSNQDFVFAGHSREIVSFTSWPSLFKTDQNGSLIWYKFYEYNIFSSSVTSLIEDLDGNYLLTGYVYDSLGQTFTSFLMKTDSAGGIVWSKIIPFSSATISLVELSISGDYIFCAGIVNNYIQGSLQDVCIVKIDSGGNIIWSKYLTNNVSNEAFDIVATQDNGCVFIGSMLIDNSPLDRDIYYGKLDSTGNRQWTKRIVLPGYDAGQHIEQTDDKGFIICGIIGGLGFGSNDVLLYKTDSLGDIVWAKIIGTTKSETPAEMIKLPYGGWLISGSVSDTNNHMSALNIRIDSMGNLLSANIYGLNDGTGFSANAAHNDYFVFAGAYNYLPPNGLLLPYIIKTDTVGISGCIENSYLLFDSTITLTVQDVSDTVVDGGLLLVDVMMNVYDETINIADSEFCFVNSIIDINFDTHIKLFPNPNNGSFSIQIDDVVNGKFIIFNSLGKIIYEQTISNSDFVTSDQNLTPGFYILKLIDNKSKTITTLKLIVQF